MKYQIERQVYKYKLKNSMMYMFILASSIFNIYMGVIVRVAVFNAIFNTFSDISWWLVLLVEETGGPGENHRPVASH